MTDLRTQTMPNLNTFITLAGFALTLGIVVFGGGTLIARIETQVAQQDQLIAEVRAAAALQEQRISDVERLAQGASDMASQDARRIVEIEGRLRATETTGVRTVEQIAATRDDIRELTESVRALTELVRRNGSFEQTRQ